MRQAPAPDWLAARSDSQIIRGGRALLFGDEIVIVEGTSCGTLSQPGQVGLDGTFIVARDQQTFRVYPQLLPGRRERSAASDRLAAV
jgi:hypothetical protein